ncbi:MAG TPA: hypothetical protein VIG80_14960 [Bacillaceae bacterium]
MPHYDKDEEKLIALLGKLPDIKDRRPMDEVYRQMDAALNRRKKKRFPVLIPALSGLAALLLIILIVPAMTDSPVMEQAQDKGGSQEIAVMDQPESSRNSSLKESVRDEAKEEQRSEPKEAEQNPPAQTLDVPGKTAVYQEDLAEGELVTIGAAAPDAIVIPVSIMLQGERKGDWTDTYRDAASKISLESYGLELFKPLLQNFQYDADAKTATVTIQSSEKAEFDQHEKLLSEMVKYAVSSKDVQTVHFVDETGAIPEMSHYGEMPDQEIPPFAKKAHYAYKLGNGEMLIVPGNGEPESLEEAIIAMKESPNDLYQTLIPADIQLEVAKTGEGQAVISFKEPLDMAKGDGAANMRMLEGLLMTAKEYGHREVLFKNILPVKWAGFDFEKPVGVPVAPNLLRVAAE